MRTPGESLGLLAYLFVVYGGFPPRELVTAAWSGGLEGTEGYGGAQPLSLVAGSETGTPSARPPVTDSESAAA